MICAPITAEVTLHERLIDHYKAYSFYRMSAATTFSNQMIAHMLTTQHDVVSGHFTDRAVYAFYDKHNRLVLSMHVVKIEP